MRLSSSFFPSFRDTPTDQGNAAERLAMRAGLAARVSPGVYALLPAGLAVVRNIVAVIREALGDVGAQEVALPALQPLEWWMPQSGSGRWSLFGDEMMSFTAGQQSFCLSPSSEELMVNVLKRCGPLSYRRLPILLHSATTRFRMSTGGRGLHRADEFLLDELYGFAESDAGIADLCARVETAYWRIFAMCGISAVKTSGVMNTAIGHLSTNFYAVSASAHDRLILSCDSCGNASEFPGSAREDSAFPCPQCGSHGRPTQVLQIGQISRLGTRYPQVFQLQFAARTGPPQCPEMCGCGLSVNRLLVAAIDRNRDDRGIIWPPPLAPFLVSIVSASEPGPWLQAAESLWTSLRKRKIAVLWDDRETSFGEKAADADLMGSPLRVALGPRSFERNAVDVRFRRAGETRLVSPAQLPDAVAQFAGEVTSTWPESAIAEGRLG